MDSARKPHCLTRAKGAARGSVTEHICDSWGHVGSICRTALDSGVGGALQLNRGVLNCGVEQLRASVALESSPMLQFVGELQTHGAHEGQFLARRAISAAPPAFRVWACVLPARLTSSLQPGLQSGVTASRRPESR